MRDIIFRGRRQDNGEWAEGSLDNYDAEHPRILLKDRSDLWNLAVFPETVGQFTGLTDKNGKRIFEGDIIRTKEFCIKGTLYNDHNYEVVFRNGCFMLSKKRRVTHGVGVWQGIGEVIGNIHENPELIGNKEGGEEEPILKECICGGELVFLKETFGYYDNKTYYMVVCAKCGIATPPCEDKREAVRRWNRRATK